MSPLIMAYLKVRDLAVANVRQHLREEAEGQTCSCNLCNPIRVQVPNNYILTQNLY